MQVKLPQWLQDEREALYDEIRQAFANVDLKMGITWTESVAIDLSSTDERSRRARQYDRDRPWEELVDDPRWRPRTGSGGWCFLDAIGFRYYLPAAMMRGLRGEDDGAIIEYLLPDPPSDYATEKWTRLDARQRCCIQRYLIFWHLVRDDWPSEDEWEEELLRELASERREEYSETFRSVWPCDANVAS